jgi:hypothetical protein
MISDEDVKRLFQNGQAILAKHGDRNKPLYTQFYRGIRAHSWENQHPGSCERHMSVFDMFNIIPKYCFNCYKVLIEPRTVVELFKLMVVFEKLELPNDNTRKCIVECREQVSGTYRGFIYCKGIEEGNEILKMVQKVISEEISKKIPVTLKRGCSEYALAYPEYARIGQGTVAMEYKEEWQECEDLADKKLPVNTQPPVSNTYNRPAYTLQDAQVMLAWLKYAATIGDLSYLKISNCILQPFQNVKRPSPFHPVENE